MAAYMDYAREVATSRKDDYGGLLGFWHGEIGVANSVWNLWEHDSLDSREALRAELQRNDVWRSTYLPRVQPLFRQGSARVMEPLIPLRDPVGKGNVYELRFIRGKAGRSRHLAHLLADSASPTAVSMTIGIWTCINGHANEIVHLSAYPDLAKRLQSPLQSPEWRNFLDENGESIDQMESSLLIPVSHSPMQ